MLFLSHLVKGILTPLKWFHCSPQRTQNSVVRRLLARVRPLLKTVDVTSEQRSEEVHLPQASVPAINSTCRLIPAYSTDETPLPVSVVFRLDITGSRKNQQQVSY